MRGRLKAMDRRRAILFTGITGFAVVALVILVAGSDRGSRSGSAATPTRTATVARRTLAERLTATGTIGYSGETTVLARLSGTVTALPVVGSEIHRGERLYAVAGEPVLLMYGAVPAYRDLAEGIDDGPDVEQLERNLAALGYEPGVVDEEFTSLTADAVRAWEAELGLEVDGEVELGRVAFLPGPRRVTELEATLGEALGGGGAGAGENAMVAWHPEARGVAEAEEAREGEDPQAEPEPETQQESPPSEESGAARGRPKQSEPKAEGHASEPEPEVEPGSVPVLRTSSTRRVVKVELAADQQSVARQGQRVEVILPGGGSVPARVRRLAATEVSPAEGGPGEPEPALEVTISPTARHRIPALDGATVSVRFTADLRRDVLSVPLTALVAIPGERFAVVVDRAGTRRRIEVTPGVAADGYVEIDGDGLREGMRVEVPE